MCFKLTLNAGRTAYRWMNSWFWTIETKNEFVHSKKVFFDWLKNDTVLDALTEGAAKAMTALHQVSLKPYECMFARYKRLFVFAFDEKTTSLVEAMNSSMKRGVIPVRANMTLAKSAATMTASSNHKMVREKMSAERDESRTALFSKSDTKLHLNKRAEGIVIEEFDNRTKHHGALGE